MKRPAFLCFFFLQTTICWGADPVLLIEGGIVEEVIGSTPVEQLQAPPRSPSETGTSLVQDQDPSPLEDREEIGKDPFEPNSLSQTNPSLGEEPLDAPSPVSNESPSYFDPNKKWYLEAKPGYYYLSDSNMRSFFNDGGFAIRAEAGCRFWGPLMVWIDGSYFEKTGHSIEIDESNQEIEGNEKLKLRLATLTLGLKGIYQFSPYFAFYAGAGPRLFMMLLHNDSSNVASDDNEVGIGAGFDGGIWCFPIPQWPNFFLDLFADYSWKKMKIHSIGISSIDNESIDVSGVTAGAGIGIRF